MVITDRTWLPTYEELTVEEIPLSSPSLRAGAFHLGKYCENQNNEFMLCRSELDPRKCVNEGKAVTSCSLEFFRKVKKVCYNEFERYAYCIDKSHNSLQFHPCRRTEEAFNKCMIANMNLERPKYDYYCLPHSHQTDRPKPEKRPLQVFEGTPASIMDDPDAPKPLPPKYGIRYFWLR